MKTLILILVLSFCSMAFGASFKITQQAKGTATSTSTKVADFNYRRCYILVVNEDIGNSLYVKLGSAHSSNEGVLIPAGGSWEPSAIPVDSIYLKSDVSLAYRIVEGDCL